MAALDGARALDKDASSFLVDSNKGGGEVGRVSILPNVPSNDPKTTTLIERVEDETRKFEDESGLEAAAGGTAGKQVEYDKITSGRLPPAGDDDLARHLPRLVLILRSLFLPAIAVVLNLLTVAAAFGVLSLLFVGDNPAARRRRSARRPLGGEHLHDLLRAVDRLPGLPPHAHARGVRPHPVERLGDRVRDRQTAQVVTGAAAIMIAVFTAFAVSDFVILKQFGVGLVVAVLIDATIVRLVLLPAVMRLFGLTTWWLPTWLDERLPVLDVEGSEYAHEAEAMQPARA